MIDKVDLNLSERDLNNTLENRSLRILDEEITRLERRLVQLQFVRDTVKRHLDRDHTRSKKKARVRK